MRYLHQALFAVLFVSIVPALLGGCRVEPAEEVEETATEEVVVQDTASNPEVREESGITDSEEGALLREDAKSLPQETTGKPEQSEVYIPPPSDPPYTCPKQTFQPAILQGRSGRVWGDSLEDPLGRVDEVGNVFKFTPRGQYSEEKIGCIDNEGYIYRETGGNSRPIARVYSNGELFNRDLDDEVMIGFLDDDGRVHRFVDRYNKEGNPVVGRVDAPTLLAGAGARLILLDE